MSFDINTNYQYGVVNYNATKAAAEEATKKTEEQAAEDKKTQRQDGFVRSAEMYKPDTEKINELKADMKTNMGAFKAMVQSAFQTQGSKANTSLQQLFAQIGQNNPALQAQAQQAISEDGEWGVEAVSDRLLDMAKALSGGDPAKIETLRKAVQDGFKAAEGVWGGKLPSISQQTYDRTMEKFDEWAKEGTAVTGEE